MLSKHPRGAVDPVSTLLELVDVPPYGGTRTTLIVVGYHLFGVWYHQALLCDVVRPRGGSVLQAEFGHKYNTRCLPSSLEEVVGTPNFVREASYFVTSLNGDRSEDFKRVVHHLLRYPHWHWPNYDKLYNNCWDFCRAVCRGMDLQYGNTLSHKASL
uniref:PPPDE domain-containing protein n=1 Tax=Chromera velia CCMP2878 TaxID=1169474 RepID=A0A0G4IA66_9ALVE|eukprot:Cvel_12365.t1-p1 / transcript=Cvel_12365.t1 / gene=Cvel_12365 / organism=Chromera_velia_CCMP2878 / gene_product=hypothetical protein / transcript_product=hypothetical protein / location=Cvel_scaffold806:26262-26729(-) / protein_length=156 / sequence_SO=supercontig / SO=protein_coding / is_pseudo=false